MGWIAFAVETVCALLTVSAMVYGLLALVGARAFTRDARRLRAQPGLAPGVSILKPVRGVDPRMYAGLASHCVQQYQGPFEIIFGVSSLDDPAVAEIARLRVEFPAVPIEIVECAQRLGANGKVSNLAQMLPHAQYEHVIVNDSDIRVAPHYLANVLRPFADAGAGLVTVPYIGLAERTLGSKMEALGIATDFFPGVLVARKLEHGIRFGLGSTLATTKTALAAIGGFEALVDQLADDYELGARIADAGFRVELIDEVVATTIPAYTLRGFCEHQLRWARSTRDSRRAGYLGLGVTYMLPWALMTFVASGGALWSLALASLALLIRAACALLVGVGLLGDAQVLRDLWLVPLRDCFGLLFWAWSYAGDTIAWRGERFRLKRGKLERF
jgi:ceramide glucosyltransferase